VIDLAVGVVIGGAFGKVVSSLVDHVLMPPIGYLIGGIDFSDLALRIEDPLRPGKGVLIQYGLFLNTVVQFVIVAFAILLLVRLLNRLSREPAKPAAPPPDLAVLIEIRDLLKAQVRE
jgi:large conductance mechanosensitive channel